MKTAIRLDGLVLGTCVYNFFRSSMRQSIVSSVALFFFTDISDRTRSVLISIQINAFFYATKTGGFKRIEAKLK